MRSSFQICMVVSAFTCLSAVHAYAQLIPPAFGLPLTDATNTPAAPVLPEPVEPPRFSYGKNGASLFYTPDQIDRMKRALEVYESKKDIKTSPVPEDVPAVEKVAEPSSYPVFYLTSIMYRNANDWTIWISGFKITSQKNTTDLQVKSVSPDSVTFTWKPAFTEAFQMRTEGKNFADPGLFKNRLQANAPLTFDAESGVVSFTLRQNQAFSVGHYAVFEGYVDPPSLGPLLASADNGGSANPAVEPTNVRGKGPQKPGGTAGMEDPNVRNMKNVMRNMPQVNPSGAAGYMENEE